MRIKFLRFSLSVIVTFVIYMPAVVSQNDSLKLVRKSDGIFVYKQKDAYSNINRIVAQTIIDAHYLKIFCLIKDFHYQKEWIYANNGAICIDSISPDNWIYYGISKMPWPFQNRDVVADVNLKVNRADKELIIQSVSKPGLIPESSEMVRIQLLNSKWKLKKLDDKTYVELDLLVDVGGNVPVWLINMFAAKGPFNTFKNMKKELQNPDDIKNCGYKDFFE